MRVGDDIQKNSDDSKQRGTFPYSKRSTPNNNGSMFPSFHTNEYNYEC